MLASFAIGMGGTGTAGYSHSAQYVRDRMLTAFQDLQRPEFYFTSLKKALYDLQELMYITNNDSWDGYQAKAVPAESFERAVSFLAALPGSVEVPSVSVEPDGHVSFEWYKSPHRTLSVSVSPEGDLHYAALVGPSKAFGTEVFAGRLPDQIHDLIDRVDAD